MDRENNQEYQDIFSFGGLKAAPGEKTDGWMELAGGQFTLPAAVIRGKKPGKTVLITAGIHGGEYVGIQSAVELVRDLKAEKVTGTIVIVKVVSRAAFESRAGSLGMEDGKNLNRIFPGDPNGSQTERLAYALSTQLLPLADCYIDLHSGDDYEKLTPYVYYAGKASEEVVRISRGMAEQVDVPYMVKSNVSGGGAYNYAASQGIPSILIERGGMGQWNYEEIGSMKRDVKNILCHLGVYTEKKEYRQYYPLEVTDLCYQVASYTGLWYPFKNPGDMIQRGEILGEVRDYRGNLIEVSQAEMDGVILFCTGSLQVLKEGPMIAYGRIVRNFDNRKERITRYWGKRSESFLEQRRAELNSPMAQRWREEILAYLPSDRKLKILDVGCGSGFFTILLSKMGHEVVGTDLTPEMVRASIQLAQEEQASCEFLQMDAENLEFENETFDVVISRNLTWTLPDAEQAYKEWIRVLKKGGVLLNFDANYGADDTSDVSNLPKNHAHNKLGDEMMRECEEIKRQLPISSRVRPAWDIEVLSRMGIQKFSLDMGVSSRIYIEKDEFYNPVPLFTLYGVK